MDDSAISILLMIGKSLDVYRISCELLLVLRMLWLKKSKC
jgi:hypothetical protein